MGPLYVEFNDCDLKVNFFPRSNYRIFFVYYYAESYLCPDIFL